MDEKHFFFAGLKQLLGVPLNFINKFNAQLNSGCLNAEKSKVGPEARSRFKHFICGDRTVHDAEL